MALRRVFPIVIALFLSIPAAVAGWTGKGGYEPDTANDRTDRFMFQDATDSYSGDAVYFNGFLTQSAQLTYSSTSINLGGPVRTANEPLNDVAFVMFGVWKDCNKDGYIGNLDEGYVYRVELLLDNSLCPAKPTYPTHNDGRWVYEFNPISWENKSRTTSGDANAFVDNSSKVWADHGLPDEVLGASCVISPQPPGTFRSTGGAIAYADCQDGYAVTHDINGLGGAAGADGLGLGQVTFGDTHDGHEADSASILNVPVPEGNADDPGYYQAFDCSQPSETQESTTVYDPTNGQTLSQLTGTTLPEPVGGQSVHQQYIPGQLVVTATDRRNRVGYTNGQEALPDHYVNTGVGAPDPNKVRTDGSLMGTLNETDWGATSCDPNRGDLHDQIVGPAGAPGTMGDVGHCPSGDGGTLCESSLVTDFKGRTRPDSMLTSEMWPHQYCGYNVDCSSSADNVAGGTATDASDKDIIILGGDFRQYWNSFDQVDNTGPVNRDLTPAGARHWTFYGFLSPGAITSHSWRVPSSVFGSYGSEACTKSALDHLVRFDCNINDWWRDENGDPITPDSATVDAGACGDTADDSGGFQCDPRPFVGSPYNFRDIDCYDNSVGVLRDAQLTPASMLGGGGC